MKKNKWIIKWLLVSFFISFFVSLGFGASKLEFGYILSSFLEKLNLSNFKLEEKKTNELKIIFCLISAGTSLTGTCLHIA